MITTTVWLIIQPERRGIDGRVVGLSADRILKTPPNKLSFRDIAVQLHIEVDERLFTSPQPEVTLRLDDERAFIVPRVNAELPPAEAEDAEDGHEDFIATEQDETAGEA